MGEMTPEERDELRRDLDAAGCPVLASSVAEDSGLLSRDEEAELRSLLRREDRLRVMEAGVRAADRLLYGSEMTPTRRSRYVGSIEQDCRTVDTAVKLLEAEVPDGQG